MEKYFIRSKLCLEFNSLYFSLCVLYSYTVPTTHLHENSEFHGTEIHFGVSKQQNKRYQVVRIIGLWYQLFLGYELSRCKMTVYPNYKGKMTV